MVWFGAMSLHVFADARAVGRWLRTTTGMRLAGGLLRSGLVVGALFAGVAVAWAALPAAHAWAHRGRLAALVSLP